MNPVDNNQFEIRSAKRKIKTGPNVYLNPALDLLANEDPMCNTAMEVTPYKRRKRTTSCDIAAFENTALDLGISKTAVNEFLVRELQNVNKNVRAYETPIKTLKLNKDEPIYANLTDTPPLPPRNVSSQIENQSNTDNLDNCNESLTEIDPGTSILEQKSIKDLANNDLSVINNTTNVQTNITNQVFINNSANLNLSFIDRLAIDSPQVSSQSLYFDDELNESNIMEIKTITIITKKKIIPKNNTNPFLDPNLNVNLEIPGQNPFLDNVVPNEMEYNEEVLNRPVEVPIPQSLMPRRLFNDTNSTISTVNETSLRTDSHEYENVEYRSESPIYENIEDMPALQDNYLINKQSKILGHDVTKFNAVDIMNLNKMLQTNSSNESTDSKKDLKHHILKASNKLSKKVFKTLRRFKSEKIEQNATLNPYEVPRKPPKEKIEKKDSGIENPALKLDNSDDIEIEEEELIENEDEQYETIKTIRNTHLNENVTPLKERANDTDSSHNKTSTPGKKVRFDSTLNREKVITGDSFNCDIQSPGFDAKIDKYHDELENCINERKFIQQNM